MADPETDECLTAPTKHGVASYLFHADVSLKASISLKDWFLSHKVTKLSLYKSRKESEHEMVVAEVLFPGKRSPVHLRIERTRGRDPMPLNMTETATNDQNPREASFFTKLRSELIRSPLSTSASRSYPTSSSLSLIDQLSVASVNSYNSSSDSSQAGCPADDRFDCVSVNPNHLLLYTFVPSEMSLFHLAQLAVIVRDQDRFYSLFRRQCYWFATLLYRVAYQKHPPLPSSPPAEMNHAADIAVDDVLVQDGDSASLATKEAEKGQPHKNGTWRGIKVLVLKEELINIVGEEYWRVISTKIKLAEQQRDKLDEERQRSEEAIRKQKEAEATAEKAEATAEEALLEVKRQAKMIEELQEKMRNLSAPGGSGS